MDGVIFNGSPNLDPNQIESISVLKDAASTALYGSREQVGLFKSQQNLVKGTNQLSVRMNKLIRSLIWESLKIDERQQQKMYDFWADEMKYSDGRFYTLFLEILKILIG